MLEFLNSIKPAEGGSCAWHVTIGLNGKAHTLRLRAFYAIIPAKACNEAGYFTVLFHNVDV